MVLLVKLGIRYRCMIDLVLFAQALQFKMERSVSNVLLRFYSLLTSKGQS